MSKLGQAYTVLGFLKREKIDYQFDGKKLVVFPCLYCGEELSMDAVSTKWECAKCSINGNIITLQKILKEDGNVIQKGKIYKPANELDQIKQKLFYYAKKHDDIGIQNVFYQVETLIQHHEKNHYSTHAE